MLDAVPGSAVPGREGPVARAKPKVQRGEQDEGLAEERLKKTKKDSGRVSAVSFSADVAVS